ncbi:hypothetical protein M569_05610, partial [Genlisea aurea]
TTTPERHRIKILIGIMMTPDKFRHRHFLRQLYNVESGRIEDRARFDAKFVFCNITDEEHRLLISLEIMLYDDVIVLDCQEIVGGGGAGKTYAFFSGLPEMFPPYDYVMKIEDDVYFRLQNLAKSLETLPKSDLYYGRGVPCGALADDQYMSGVGYLVSWDIVEWISVADMPGKKNYTAEAEDKAFAEWISDGDRGKNRYDVGYGIHDLPGSGSDCSSHEMWDGAVGVHGLDRENKWIDTLDYFNVTKGLENTKMYHI